MLCDAVACYAQIVIDITKHAVLGKFNDIRPGIYKEYMRDLCSDSLDKHSHNTHKLVRHIYRDQGWVPTFPLGPALPSKACYFASSSAVSAATQHSS